MGKPVSGIWIDFVGKPVSGLWIDFMGKPVSGLWIDFMINQLDYECMCDKCILKFELEHLIFTGRKKEKDFINKNTISRFFQLWTDCTTG